MYPSVLQSRTMHFFTLRLFTIHLLHKWLIVIVFRFVYTSHLPITFNYTIGTHDSVVV